ncbi:tetratricopeptide repeat protein [candidate division KSB1 bacterium]|nr:tetratricopeptide repeat protein [candidate division KSB1 bacterium]
MKRYMLLFLIPLLFYCAKDENRRIRLSSRSEQSFMQDEVTTIQVAIAHKKSVAILGFMNRTRDTELNWLNQGIVEMFRDDLGQLHHLYIIEGEKIEEMKQTVPQNATLTLAALTDMAKRMSAQAIIYGSYYLKDDSLTVQLVLYDSDSEKLLLSESRSGDGLSSIFSIVPELILEVKNSLQTSRIDGRQLAESEVDYQSAYLATRSLEAYKNYAKGIEYANRIYHEQAIACFEKAIALDSTFVSAYQKLSFAQATVGNLDLARSTLRKGLPYVNSAPPREKRIYLAYQAFMNGDFYNAVRYYEEVCESFPEDGESHYNLSVIYHNLQIHEKSIEHAKAALALGYEQSVIYNQLGYIYQEIGKHEYAQNVLQKYIKLLPDEPNPHDSMGDILRFQGDLDAAIEEYQKALEREASFTFSRINMAYAYLDKGNFKETEKILKKLSFDPYSQAGLRATLLAVHSKILQQDYNSAQRIVLALNDSLPYTITTIRLLLDLFPQKTDIEQRMDRLINHVKQNPDDFQSFDKLYDLVLCCIKADYHLEFAEELLQQARARSSNMYMRFSILGFIRVLEMIKKNPDLQLLESDRPETGPKSLDVFPTIGWEDYYRYYHMGLINISSRISDVEALEGMWRAIEEMQDENFRLQSKLGYIHLSVLLSDSGRMKNHLQHIGMPVEQAWRILPPFRNTHGFHNSFWPEKMTAEDVDAEMDNCRLVGFDGVLDGYIDLYSCAENKFNQTYYALLPVNCVKSRNVQLRLGSNRPVKVWLNDENIFTINRYERCHIDRYKIAARLKSGMNWILLKSTSRLGQQGFYFRITDEQGMGVRDIYFNRLPKLFSQKSGQGTL